MSHMSRPPIYRNESMQKYMLLSAQKEALQRRMSLQLPSAIPMEVSSPEFQSLSSSPEVSPKYISPYPAASDPIPVSKSSLHPRSTMDDSHIEEAHKLAELNLQIVATLTELLNTECVRSSEKQRAWIQDRLMEAEHQMRRSRRRHSSNAERDFASVIAHNLDLGLHAPKTWT